MDVNASRALTPLSYHRAVIDYLRESEPAVWEWASSVQAQQEHADTVRAQLLRHTYRLSAQSHPHAHAAAAQVAQRLGLQLPITLYQGPEGTMNASLYFLSEEVHVVFTGPVLEKLAQPELLALLGHELAHHVLWTADGGIFHAADRILHQTASDAGAAPAHVNTARLYSLYTEIFADRGAAVAAESALPAISALVKTHTGLTSVDPEAYLQQALEIEGLEKNPSAGSSHPEAFLRARAVDRWWQQDPAVDAWLSERIEGALVMSQLDVTGQQQLQDLTRRLIAHLLGDPRFASERVRNHAREYFPEWSDSEAHNGLPMLPAGAANDSVLNYLSAVLLDFALVDADSREEGLSYIGRIALGLGADKHLLTALRKHLGMPKRAMDKLAKQWSRDAS